MESLSDGIWDVVISGTSLPQSLLALALSRSGKKVLHVDRHAYYGGKDAGLSLDDAQEWVSDLRNYKSAVFAEAAISTTDTGKAAAALGASRSYTLSLNPQIIYAKSEFLPTLVSSRIHAQLEFLAVGSWWVLREGQLHKIPSTREDVFSDESLSMRDKRGLMKFLRYVLKEDEDAAHQAEDDASSMSLKEAMLTKFKIAQSLQAPILALALSPVSADSVPFDKALARIRRHMSSIGYFGQGFGAVIPKYGGNAEIAQVACRAQAVGGGTYLLGHGLQSYRTLAQTDEESELVECTLSDGTRVRARHVVGALDDLPSTKQDPLQRSSGNTIWLSINVVADPLRQFFSPTSENGPVPAVAIVLVDLGRNEDDNPVYLQIHSEDTGECPAGQCVVYGSLMSQHEAGKSQLETAMKAFLDNVELADSLLWSMSYQVAGQVDEDTAGQGLSRPSAQIMMFQSRPHDMALEDALLESVKQAWETILGPELTGETDFLRFEERESEVED